MRLILIRHGEPDYEHDTLTEKGWREAACLAGKAKNWNVQECFVSPLGRARDTARDTLAAWGMKEQILPWLKEFSAELQPTEAEAFRNGRLVQSPVLQKNW